MQLLSSEIKWKSFGPYAVVLAAFLWSLDGLLRTQLYSLPPMVVVFFEHLLGIVLLAPMLFFSFQEFKKFTKKQWISITVVSLLSGVLGTYFYTAGLLKIQFIPFSVVVLLQQLQPIFAIVTAAILLREPLSKKFVLLAFLALVAAYFVSFPDLHVNFGTGTGTLTAAIFAILAAMFWGSSTAFSKYTLKGTSYLHVTGARFLLTPIFALIFILFFGQTASFGAITGTQWLYLLAITFSTGMVALALYYFGLQRVPASRSTILELTWPVSAVLIGYLFLDQTLTWTQWMGSIALILIMNRVAQDARKVQ